MYFIRIGRFVRKRKEEWMGGEVIVLQLGLLYGGVNGDVFTIRSCRLAGFATVVILRLGVAERCFNGYCLYYQLWLVVAERCLGGYLLYLVVE